MVEPMTQLPTGDQVYCVGLDERDLLRLTSLVDNVGMDISLSGCLDHLW